MKVINIICCFFTSFFMYSQVGVGTVVPNGAFEVNSNNQGVIFPRVSLNSINSSIPVINPTGGSLINGTLVYNISFSGTSPNNVVPGYYYWETNKWVLIRTQSSTLNMDWSILGNSSIDSNLHFIGTTNTEDLVVKTNGTEKMRVKYSGEIGIGIATPNRKMEINSGSLLSPPIRLTQQTSNNIATSNLGDNSKVLVVDQNGDMRTKVNEKRYTPNNCSCASVPFTGIFPFTLPSDLTTFELYDGDWTGNHLSNTTLPDFILPTVNDAIASGHKYGDIVVIFRKSSANVVIGKQNTNMNTQLLIPLNYCIFFRLGIDKWYIENI